MTPHPVLRELVPEAPLKTALEGFTVVEDRLLAGLPQRIELGPLALVLLLPSGLATAWRDAEANTPVSTSASERGPHLAQPDTPYALPERPPVRLAVRDGQTTTAVVPLVAGRQRLLPDASGRACLELCILEWTLVAGSLQGPGDVGSRLRLAWRDARLAPAEYAPLPPNPYLLPRLPDTLRLQSALRPLSHWPLSLRLLQL